MRLKSVCLPVSVCCNGTTWLTNTVGACGVQDMIKKCNQLKILTTELEESRVNVELSEIKF